MPERALRRPELAIAAALALAALTLLLPWALAFDPWAWLVWGREATRFELDTAGGPSWKPLPVLFTTPFSLAGGAAPILWLVVARAGALLALAGVAALAGRLAGPVAAATAAATMAFSDWWFFNAALGNSEGVLVAAVVWAIVAHLAGRERTALGLVVVAGLARPEAWPFAALYALWLWRSGRMPLWLVALALAPILLLWFGPDVLGSGGALGASDAARGVASAASAANADVPALEVLGDFARLLTLPVLAAAIAGAALGGATARWLAAGALAWVVIVALMTLAGYAGNPRYNVPAAAIGCALAGVGVVRVAARLRPASPAVRRWVAPVLGAALTAAVLALTLGTLRDQLDELGQRAQRREDLDVLAAESGQAASRPGCDPIEVRTAQSMRAMVAWRLDVPMAGLTDPPAAGALVFQAPPGYDAGELPEGWTAYAPLVEPDVPLGFEVVDRRGDWVLACDVGADD